MQAHEGPSAAPVIVSPRAPDFSLAWPRGVAMQTRGPVFFLGQVQEGVHGICIVI